MAVTNAQILKKAKANAKLLESLQCEMKAMQDKLDAITQIMEAVSR